VGVPTLVLPTPMMQATRLPLGLVKKLSKAHLLAMVPAMDVDPHYWPIRLVKPTLLSLLGCFIYPDFGEVPEQFLNANFIAPQ